MRNSSRPDADVDILQVGIANVFDVMLRIQRHVGDGGSGNLGGFAADMNAGAACHHEVHLDESRVRIGRGSATGSYGFERGLKTLRVVSRDQHGVQVSRTQELLPFVQPPANHRSLVFISTNKGRQVSRFISLVGKTTSGERCPLRLIFAMAILAN